MYKLQNQYIMIKKITFAIALLLMATAVVAQSGLTCDDPIQIDSSYVGRVDGPCTLWYTAGTYDLPLNVHFIPDNYDSDMSPEVVIDLTCVPGVYADPKVDSLLTMVEDFGISFPIELWCDRTLNGDKVEWDLFVDDMYREQMAEFGVTYNVQAFVQVTFYEAGTISLRPDLTFADCVNNSEHVVLDDSIAIEPDDRQRVFIMPYTDWQNDSIQFVWTGDEPATVWIASGNCDFNPSPSSGYVWDNYVVSNAAPYKLSNKKIVDAIKNNSGGGLLYAKVTSATAGKLLVEKIPLPKPQAGAQLLEYGTTVSLDANDTTLYCFPTVWGSSQILAAPAANITMYASAQPVFECSKDDAAVVAAYPFSRSAEESELSLSLKDLSTMTSKASDSYIYVRFISNVPTAITPVEWASSECADKSTAVVAGNVMATSTSTVNTVYRLRYDDWKDSDMEIYWHSARGTVTVYIADTCSFATGTFVAQQIIKSKETFVMDVATMATWADRVDADGYLYVRFKPQSSGSVTFTSAAPEAVYTDFSATVCFGETYDWNGTTYAETGSYSQTFVAANGADSIVTLNLTILPAVPLTEETAIVCHGESFDWQGTTYTESGDYSVNLKNVHGCDSVVLLHLHVLSEVAPTTETVEVAFGETYEWHGVTYVESGEYTITLQDANGCDYQATLHLTVLPNPEKTDLQPTDMMPLALQDAFKVITMEQALWSSQDVQLRWDGVSPLHVFVAKQKVYALTPYNRHVLHYEMIPAGAEWTLTKDMMAAWESYIAEGMLYVRFLTELPGTLTTTVAE